MVLVTLQIDDLTVAEDVDFTPESSSPVLTVDRLEINGPTTAGDTVVTLSQGEIKTTPCGPGS